MMEEVAIIADSKGKGYEFAKGIYEYVRGKPERSFPVRLIDVETKRFKDGEFKEKIKENIRRRKCFFIHDSNKEPAQWYTELSFVMDAMASSSPSEVNVILPYMRFSRQDRKDESRVSVNAKVVAKMISEYGARGMTVDLHASQEQSYFEKSFDNLYSFPSLVNYLKKNHPKILEELVIVSPDLGGGKRADYLGKKFVKEGIETEVALGYKRRKKEDKVEETVIIGLVEDKNCLIVDDIIDTGNTMVEAAKSLKEIGARRIFGYGTHGLFTEGIEKFKIFDKVLVSDTLKVPEAESIEIVSLVNLFGEAVYKTIKGESLSSLFDD